MSALSAARTGGVAWWARFARRAVVGRRRDVAVSAVAAAVGVGFSAVRIGVGLDAAGLLPEMAAFAGLGALAIGLLLASGIGVRAVGLTAPRRTGLILCPLVALLAFVGVGVLTGTPGAPAPRSVLVGIVLYAGAVAPAEELLFRGVLYAAVERRGGPAAAVSVSAAAFAVAHLPVYGVGALPLMLAGGLVLGWCRAWSRSLAAPVAVHALADLAALWT